MKCFVTGASGFIGANLVHELVAGGHSVKLLLRPGADTRGLAGLDYERVDGDLGDPALLGQALRGCDWCFHVAAVYHLWMRDYRPMYAANVEGTRNLIEAAGKAGCSRIVYTSTVGCIGLPKPDANGTVSPTDEETPVSEAQMTNHYKRSKWQAEQVAAQAVEPLARCAAGRSTVTVLSAEECPDETTELPGHGHLGLVALSDDVPPKDLEPTVPLPHTLPKVGGPIAVGIDRRSHAHPRTG